MTTWESQVIQSITGIDEAYRQPLLDIIKAYVRSVEISKPSGRLIGAEAGLSDKKKALMRMEELRTEFTFPEDFDPDRELEEARKAKYGSID